METSASVATYVCSVHGGSRVRDMQTYTAQWRGEKGLPAVTSQSFCWRGGGALEESHTHAGVVCNAQKTASKGYDSKYTWRE